MINPTLNARVFNSIDNTSTSDSMTVDGTVNKSLILAGLFLASAAFAWSQLFAHQPIGALVAIGAIVGLIAYLVIVFAPSMSAYASPVYALAQGLFIGAVSAMFEAQYHGIVLTAVALTAGVLVSLLLAYKARLIEVTEKFRAGVIIGIMALCLISLLSFVLGIFGLHVPYIYEAGPIGIVFSMVCVVLASMSMLLNFDWIERGQAENLPKYMEWYCAFALLVTLIWLYIEILDLLAKIQGGRRND